MVSGMRTCDARARATGAAIRLRDRRTIIHNLTANRFISIGSGDNRKRCENRYEDIHELVVLVTDETRLRNALLSRVNYYGNCVCP